LKKTFEAVEEMSERGSPAATPEKKGSLTPRRRREYPRSPYVFAPTWPSKHARSDSTASELSAASVDSVGGTYDGFGARSSRPQMKQLSLASSSSSSKASSRVSLRLDNPFEASQNNGEPAASSKPTPSSVLSPIFVTSPSDLVRPSLDATAAQNSLDVPASRGDETIRTSGDTAGRRRVSFDDAHASSSLNKFDAAGRATLAPAHDVDDGCEVGDEKTLRPIRSQNTSAGPHTASASPPMSPTKGSLALAELFGLDVPARLSTSGKRAIEVDEGKKDEDDLMTMFVPDRHDDVGSGGEEAELSERRKKGSLVLIRRASRCSSSSSTMLRTATR
jgi:hypothetical protein